MMDQTTHFPDDTDLEAVRGFRSDLAGLDEDRFEAARSRFAQRDGANEALGVPPRRRRRTAIVAGACAVGVAAAVAGMVVWTWPGGGRSGIAPAGGSSTSTDTQTRSTGQRTSQPFSPGGALHCMALHDEPLGEVAKKLAKTDLTVTYTLPDPDTETSSRISQAEAEADTANKVSEVIDRGGGRIEVYFWDKDNMDFMSEDMVEKFEKECPDPR